MTTESKLAAAELAERRSVNLTFNQGYVDEAYGGKDGVKFGCDADAASAHGIAYARGQATAEDAARFAAQAA